MERDAELYSGQRVRWATWRLNGYTDLRGSLVKNAYIGPIDAIIVNVQSDLVAWGASSPASTSGPA